MKLDRILVPSDFSVSADHALQLASFFAGREGATLTVLHVAAMPLPTVADYGPLPVVDIQPTLDQLEQDSRRMLERQATREVPGDLAWRVKVVIGTPEKEIEGEILRGGYDLVVMGTHGRTGIRHLLLGSIAEHVLRHSTVPVLITR